MSEEQHQKKGRIHLITHTQLIDINVKGGSYPINDID